MSKPNWEEPPFIPGLDLCEAYYWEAVRPIILRHLSTLPHSAALIGYGSDVIGCDTPMSRDHMWGPRMVLFLPPCDFEINRMIINNALRQELPLTFRGYPTHFGPPDQEGVRLLTPIESGPVEHLIEIQTIEAYFERELGIDPYIEPEVTDWLTFQEHRLLSLTAGRVFHDDLELEAVRARFSYYPRDIWLYLLASQWMLISQEEPFMGRTGQNGDEIGSRVITARLVERIMRLCFLMEKQYAPYSKWFGTLFQRLKCARKMTPLLAGALNGQDWQEREQFLSQAYVLLIRMHNALDITPPMKEETSLFHGRPFQVSHGERFSEAIRAAIQDREVRALPPSIGSVNQFMVESSDALQSVSITRKARALYK